jgi:hypothetical protein
MKRILLHQTYGGLNFASAYFFSNDLEQLGLEGCVVCSIKTLFSCSRKNAFISNQVPVIYHFIRIWEVHEHNTTIFKVHISLHYQTCKN